MKINNLDKLFLLSKTDPDCEISYRNKIPIYESNFLGIQLEKN